MTDFFQAFPTLTASELRTITVSEGADLPVPADCYAFLELYCEDRGCDCRRVTIAVIAERKRAPVAYINLGFDSSDAMAGPFLDPLNPQASYAAALLRFFTDMLNDDPKYLRRLQRHYVMFKERCEGRRYAGPAFEQPGTVKRIAAEHAPMNFLKDIPGLQPSAAVRRPGKVGRNDPCPCGSGKKYKRCCMVQDKPGAARASRSAPKPPDQPGIHDPLGPERATPTEAEAPMQTAEQLIDEVARWRANPRHQQPWSPAVQRKLETTHRLALAFLRLLLTQYAPDGRQPAAPEGYDLCLALLEEALTQIRYSVERQRPWALALADQVQTEMAERAFRPEVDVRVQHDLIQALHSAKLELHPQIRDQVAAVAEYYARFGAAGGGPDLDSVLDRLVRETQPRDLLELLDPMLAQMAVTPVDGQAALAAGMLSSRQPLLKELAVLLLLHPNAQVRAQLPERYRQTDCLANIGALGLRRLIGLRNWLPPRERPTLDALIKQVRLAATVSASLPPAAPITIYASAFDGSGAQGAWLVSKEKRHYRIAGMLVKQGLGVREVWSQGGFTKREIDAKLRGMVRSGGVLPVHSDYLRRLVAHFVAVGLGSEAPPPPQLVALNELVGGEYWKPELVAPDEAIADLLARDPGACTPARVRQVMADAGDWPEHLSVAESWFEDDARIDALLQDLVGPAEDWLPRLPFAAAAIVDQILEPRRGVWAERLLWMAIWAKAAESRPPLPWQDFLIVADALQQDTPLGRIPLMQAIARRSVQSAWQRAQAR